MAGSKKEKKDRKERKDKHDRKERERDKRGKKEKSRKDKSSKKSKRSRREPSSSSSDSDEEYRRRAKLAKMTDKIAAHHEKIAIATGYTDGDNPFNDEDLSKRFVWKKKIAHDLGKGQDASAFSVTAERSRHDERLREIEKAKQRRIEREEEQARMEEELGMLDRQRAMVEAAQMAIKEEEFHLKQAKERAAKRLREGRADPIDHIVKNLYLQDEFDMDMAEPYAVLDGLMPEEIQHLAEDVAYYRELDSNVPEHADLWTAWAELLDWNIAQAELAALVDRAAMRGEELPAAAARKAALGASVATDIEGEFAGKSHKELIAMEPDIVAASQTDPDFYEEVLERLKVHKAKAKLREVHADLMEKYLDAAAARDGMPSTAEESMAVGTSTARGKNEDSQDEAGPSNTREEKEDDRQAEVAEAAAAHDAGNDEEIDLDGDDEDATPPAAPKKDADGFAVPESKVVGPSAQHDEGESSEEDEEDAQPEWLRLSDGRFSPEPVSPRLVAGQEVIGEEEDAKMLSIIRRQVKMKAQAAFGAAAGVGPDAGADAGEFQRWKGGERRGVQRMLSNIAAPAEGDMHPGAGYRTGKTAPGSADAELEALKARATQLMRDDDDDDLAFTGEVSMESKVYWWHEKYRPRKPKFFNRVHTGYEWNKYNQTHYDSDNPPPKVVQGYKFNIFYHQLINSQEAPSYIVERDPTARDGETCILRFHAGPPYEDIAFRIVNKEWEYSHKRGFMSKFERGIMHLYFNFKRLRYRR